MISLIEIEKAIMKFIWKHKQSRIAKTILSTMRETGGITVPDLKLQYRPIVTKMTWYWHQNRQADQWYRRHREKPTKIQLSHTMQGTITYNG